jgi:transposase
MTHIAMDVHKKRSTLAYVTPGMEAPKVVGCYTTREDLQRVLGGLPAPWVVVVESSRQSPCVTRWLQEFGVAELYLVDARELHRFVADKPKTDARDAKEMLRLHLMGRLPECYLASQRVQDWRTLSRARTFARGLSTATRNFIRSVLNQLGLEVRASDLCGAGAQAQLAELKAQLGPLGQVALEQLGGLLAAIEQYLHELDQAIRAAIVDQPAAQALMEMPGIGPVLALGFLAEMGEIERFEDPKHLIGYAGLGPKANDSDDYHGPRHLPKCCNKRLRNWAIQAAQCASRCQKPSKARATYQRLRTREETPLRPNVARLGAARALLTDLFYRWNRAVSPVHPTA